MDPNELRKRDHSMRTNLHRLAPLTAALAVASVAVSGCTISKAAGSNSVTSGSIQKIASLKGASLKVGSKDFEEQLVLGQVAIVALEAAGASPVDKTNIQGTNNTRLALTGAAVDLYWEYTGTAWISFLKQTKPVPDSQKQFEAVAKADAANGVTWWDRAPANNTYALAETQATLAKYGVKTLTQYAALAKKDPAAASPYAWRASSRAGTMVSPVCRRPTVSRCPALRSTCWTLRWSTPSWPRAGRATSVRCTPPMAGWRS
jgi:osmoprotectant transport system substrate-binding protein